MTFNSWEFLIFYPIVAALYFLLPKKLKWPMLLVASYYFYMFYQASLVVLIVFTTAVSFFMSRLIEKTEKQSSKKLYLAITLVACFGVLFFFKYFNFLSESAFGLINLFGGQASPVILNLILPVGISFYTFQTLSYVISASLLAKLDGALNSVLIEVTNCDNMYVFDEFETGFHKAASASAQTDNGNIKLFHS